MDLNTRDNIAGGGSSVARRAALCAVGRPPRRPGQGEVALERIRHTLDSQGQILALAQIRQSRPVSDLGTNKTVKDRFWPWLEPFFREALRAVGRPPRLPSQGAIVLERIQGYLIYKKTHLPMTLPRA